MRIALLHPTYWPEVRRGSERLVHDLGARLAARGHEVTVLTTHPDRTRVGHEDGMRVVRARRVPAWLAARRHTDEHVAAVPAQFAGLLLGRYDVAHAFYPLDAWAAVRARRLGGPPVVFSVHGILTREWLLRRRHRLPMSLGAARGAAACTVLSEPAVEPFARYLLREPEVLPGAVATRDFAVAATRAGSPTLVCAANLADPRKRGPLLMEAFGRLRGELPGARLVLAGGADGAGPSSLPEAVDRVAADATPALAEAYASAWASVLPAVDEAFGLVILESLAAGTPVVAARSGAAPQLLGTDEVGRLFRPDDPRDLARAMSEALDLAEQARTADACRAQAAAYDWDAIAPRYEALYRRVVAA